MTLKELFTTGTQIQYELLQALPVPKAITINENIFPVPDTLELITLGQKIHLESQKFDSDLQAIKKILSVWYFPTYFDINFDIQKSIEFETLIETIEDFEAIPTSKHLFSELAKLQERESKELRTKRTSEMAAAGIERLDMFGSLGTVDMLAGGDVLKYDAIYQLSWSTAFIKLKYEKERNEYEENYRNILKRKQ